MLEGIEWANGMDARTADRFWSKVDAGGDCWLWTGAKQKSGYGKFSAPGGKTVLAHRFAYGALVGAIPQGLTLDHLCRVRRCVNPDHLEPVSAIENANRGKPQRQYICRRGHLRTPENLNNDGSCVECKRINDRKRRGRDRSKYCLNWHLREEAGWVQTKQGRTCAACYEATKKRSVARRRMRAGQG